ncbi:putative metallopeptidase [Acinetobacter proteolyticus]|uniref:Transposase n=1 Tax=Acinetobacter proteolyticus TaxID=1776741 RepID=A0A2N0WBS1_9GAMM|nr:putative metallopeptidase [Acinetobacter proteolyticus]PKF31942.1 transposase [Acinetobacter proteolyticus]
MKNEIGFVVKARPYPPEHIFLMDTPDFLPAPELWRWIKANFLNPESQLFNPDHSHLGLFRYPQIAVMWARAGYKKQGRNVAGTAEKIMINASGWKKERQEEQFYRWFNDLPDYLITIDATYAQQANDIDFCALIEHELYHITHKKDQYGIPSYNRETGKPNLTMQAHDVEEFTGVVRRYGANKEVQQMIDAAKQRPEVSRADIYNACGTCFLRVV